MMKAWSVRRGLILAIIKGQTYGLKELLLCVEAGKMGETHQVYEDAIVA